MLTRSRIRDTVRPPCEATNAGTQLKYPTLITPVVALMLSACLVERPSHEAPAANTAPTISGSPPTSIRVGESYSFIPNASDADGDALNFSISNKPAWASFNASTGRLSGTPQAGNAGIDANILISVSDGKDKAALGIFSIAVNQIAMGSATLSWIPPTENADGSALTDLRGYKIYYGKSAANQDQTVKLTNPGLTRYMIENLSPATWYFSMSSFNSEGVESARSATASKTIS
jgi:hypothetical protein